jgi:hypothetical protein
VAAGAWTAGFDACSAEYPGSRFGVPANGFRNAALKAAKGSGDDVWLDYAQVHGEWTAGASSLD